MESCLGRVSVWRVGNVVAILGLALVVGAPHEVGAQSSEACATDRTVSTLVGAGLGAAVAAIPATVIHRHDQTSSHRIVVLSVSTGALIGFLGAGRDHPCAVHADSSRPADAVIAGRSSHARRGAVVGAIVGGVLGAVGSTYYNVGCTRDPRNVTRMRIEIGAFSAGEGASAGGLLGGLIGWAWHVGRQ